MKALISSTMEGVTLRRKVVHMAAGRTPIVLMLSCVLAVHLNASATTCVSNRKFKVTQVCGRVTDVSNVPTPMVDVELLDAHSVTLQQGLTDKDGIFTLANVAKGEYAIRVRYSGFAAALQPFIVTKDKPNTRCNRPMQVRLEPAGHCSSVSKAR